MKAINLNKALTLKNGLNIPAGALIIPVDNYFPVFSKDQAGNIPCQFGLQVFISSAAYAAGSTPINPRDISDFAPIVKANVSMADYISKGADNIAAQATKDALIAAGIAAGKITIVDI